MDYRSVGVYKVNIESKDLNSVTKIVISKNGQYNIDVDFLGDLCEFLLKHTYTSKVDYLNSIVIENISPNENKNIITKRSENGLDALGDYPNLKNKFLYSLFINWQRTYFYDSLVDEISEFRYLLHHVKLFELDKLVILQPHEMIILLYEQDKVRRINFERPVKEEDLYEEYRVRDRRELMGVYLKVTDKNMNYWKSFFDNIDITLEDTDRNIICLCPENIEKGTNYNFELAALLTIYHELGHLVFSYLDVYKTTKQERYDELVYRFKSAPIKAYFDQEELEIEKLKEKQANYFASFSLGAKYDWEIRELTKLQPIAYHDPLLMSDRINSKDEFEEKVDELYKGKWV